MSYHYPCQAVGDSTLEGIDGQVSLAYAYTGAKAHQDGRGYLGFREVKVTDLATGLVQTTAYRQDYPLTGLVAQETKTNDGMPLGLSVNAHTAVDLGGTRKQVTLAQSTTSGIDLDGSPLPSSAAAYQYDDFGNATQITVTNSDGFRKLTTNTYANDTATWLLGRLTGATVTSQAPPADQQSTGPDTTPDPFAFASVVAPVLTLQESSAIVTGFDVPLSAWISGGGGAQIRKNGSGDWGASVQVRGLM